MKKDIDMTYMPATDVFQHQRHYSNDNQVFLMLSNIYTQTLMTHVTSKTQTMLVKP
jgi:hypothetical protein